jgi:hypothetical protein
MTDYVGVKQERMAGEEWHDSCDTSFNSLLIGLRDIHAPARDSAALHPIKRWSNWSSQGD